MSGKGVPSWASYKIISPNLNVTLLDSLNKRVNFLNAVINELNLKGINAAHGRAEEFAQLADFRQEYDGAVSRAVANLTVLSEFCIPYIKKNGYFVALKGPAVEEEIKNLKNAITFLVVS